MNGESYHLSKSRYCSAVQCPKIIWLKENKKEEYDDSVIDKTAVENGHKVGDLAKGLFGDFSEVPYDEDDLGTMIRKTENLMKSGAEVIAEASFSADNLFCSVDILKCLKNNEVEIYEVKSSTTIHDIYYDDIAFQAHVLTLCGLKVKKCSLVYLNNQYERNGELDIHKLFIIEDVTEKVMDMQDDVRKRTEDFKKYMEQEKEPSDDIGVQCFNPYKCGFYAYCTKDLPKPNVFDIAGLNKRKMSKCYKNNIVSFEDVNTCDVLNKKQKRQVEHEIFDLPPHIEKDNVRKFMEKFSYPLYFLDFESFQPALPMFDFSKPHEKIVFQYSLHYIEEENGKLMHKAFLAYPGKDPRRDLSEQLCSDIPLDVCTVVYNMSFEKARIKRLAELYTDLSEHLMNIHDHIVDLMKPFSEQWYYCRAMQGLHSIKYVLPALFPDDPGLNYKNLQGVHDGGEASAMFEKMAAMEPGELEKSREQLLKYCGLDTYALVKIFEKLKQV